MSRTQSGIKSRVHWFTRAGVNVTRLPRSVSPPHSYKCLVRVGMLQREDTTLCKSWCQVSGKEQSPTFRQKKASPSWRFQSFPSLTSGARRHSSSLFVMYPKCTVERFVPMKEVFWPYGLSYFPKSVSLSYINANITGSMTSVIKVIRSKTLINAVMLANYTDMSFVWQYKQRRSRDRSGFDSFFLFKNLAWGALTWGN